MPRAATLLLLPLLTSCASAPPTPSENTPPVGSQPFVQIPPPVASEPPPSPPPPPAPPPGKPLPPPIALESEVACAFDAPRWDGAADITDIALRPGGKPFARITGGAARLSIPVGPAGDTVLQIRDGGLSVQGHAPAKASALRPNVPIVLNGFAIPTMYARLTWSEGAAGSLTVTYVTSADLEVLDAPLRATRPCADVGLEGGSFEAVSAVPNGDAAKKKDVKAFYEGSRVALASKPNGKPVARITVTDTTLVDVFESSGGMSRVVFPAGMLVVFGWVKTSDLKPAGSLAGFGFGRGRLGVREPAFVVKERLRCAEDVPLVAEVDGERRAVGTIDKNTTIEVLERKDDDASVRVWTKAIHAADGVNFLVRIADIYACPPLER